MKRIMFGIFASALGIIFLMAQGKVSSSGPYPVFPPYDPRTPPPLSMGEAYALAVAHLGRATNQFYCITASCLQTTNDPFTGWTFSFSNTNGQRGRVNVYFYGKAETVARAGEIGIPK